MNTEEKEDDGTLAFLNIPNKDGKKYFKCEKVSQQQLVNCAIWIYDYEEVPHMKGKEQDSYVVLFKYDRNAEEYRKFFTSAPQIIYLLSQIRERNAFPRKVHVKVCGRSYTLE